MDLAMARRFRHQLLTTLSSRSRLSTGILDLGWLWVRLAVRRIYSPRTVQVLLPRVGRILLSGVGSANEFWFVGPLVRCVRGLAIGGTSDIESHG
jgi:hypothetical protein